MSYINLIKHISERRERESIAVKALAFYVVDPGFISSTTMSDP